MSENKERKLKIKPGAMAEGADSLSLGISIVVAILIGVALGYGLKTVFGIAWLMWVGVGIGIAAAVLNVFKAYSKQYKMYEELAKEPRYAIKKKLEEEDDDDDDLKY